MKIHPLGGEVFDADRQTDGQHSNAYSCILQFLQKHIKTWDLNMKLAIICLYTFMYFYENKQQGASILIKI
jgi:hypothetical protein